MDGWGLEEWISERALSRRRAACQSCRSRTRSSTNVNALAGKGVRTTGQAPNTNLTVYRVAKNAGISQPTLQLIVSGKQGITAETALRLGLYFGVDAQFWLNLQVITT